MSETVALAPPGFIAVPSRSRPGQICYLETATGRKYGTLELAWQVHHDNVPATGDNVIEDLTKSIFRDIAHAGADNDDEAYFFEKDLHLQRVLEGLSSDSSDTVSEALKRKRERESKERSRTREDNDALAVSSQFLETAGAAGKDEKENVVLQPAAEENSKKSSKEQMVAAHGNIEELETGDQVLQRADRAALTTIDENRQAGDQQQGKAGDEAATKRPAPGEVIRGSRFHASYQKTMSGNFMELPLNYHQTQ